jgi:SAM-dependent methyltransferase
MMLASAAGRIARRLERELPAFGRARRAVILRGRFQEFRRLQGETKERLPLSWSERRAVLGEATAATPFDRHYVYHVAWALRVLAETAPSRHVDVGSSLYFVAAASAHADVEFYDYRPAALELDRVTTGAADLVDLPFADRSVPSLSCMHVVEHVGLGRYGDPLDPDGDLKAMAELARVLAPGGSLLFVVPVGRPRVVFNAHRVYGYDDVVEPFAELELVEFALIPDDPGEGLIRRADPALVGRQRYGCGCFWFRRPRA